MPAVSVVRKEPAIRMAGAVDSTGLGKEARPRPSRLVRHHNNRRTEGVIQFPPEMDENWVRYGLAKLEQISRLPNWQRMLFCAYTTQLLH